jgi:hypothetical protein
MSLPAESSGARRHPLRRWLRARVMTLRAATRRRLFPGAVELVADGASAHEGPAAAWCYGDEPCDHALRVDVLVRLLTDCGCRGLAAVNLVHVRPGPHEASDLDLGWAAAADAAAAISGVEVRTVLVVSRWGWLDLRTGDRRSWVRLRPRAG